MTNKPKSKLLVELNYPSIKSYFDASEIYYFDFRN